MRTRGEVLDWLTRATFDPEAGCQHSHLTIALAIGRSERQVIRCIDELEAAGELDVDRAPRGSRRCNTYRVRAWNPNLRSEVVGRCQEIRPERNRILQARNAKCQSKRTAKPSKGSDARCVPQPNRALTPVFAVNVFKNRAQPRKSAVVASEGRRMSKQPPAPNDHCGLCGISPSEHAGLLSLTRRLAGQIDRLTRKVDGKDTSNTRRALELAAEWREAFDMPKGTALAPNGPRVGAVKRALSWGFDAEQVRACYRGGRRCQFVVYGERKRSGTDEQRKVDLTDLLKDEKTIEALIRLADVPTRRQEPRFDRPLSLEEFAGRIEGARQGSDGQWSGRCPAHDDRHASLGFRQGEKGIVARCMVGCSITEIAGALRLEVSQLFDPDAPRREPLPVREAEPLPSSADIARWTARAQSSPRLADRLAEVKGWSLPTLERLHVGWDGQRVTFPIANAAGDVVNVIRYLPGGKPKTLGLRHRSRGLFPAPETIDGRVWLVEGEPDAVSGHELGLPAVGVPGTNGWRPEWAERFHGRSVVVCFDCDDAGRKAALKVGASLAGHAKAVRVVDLNVKRTDGFDVTDALREGWMLEQFVELAKAASVAARFGGERAA